MTLVTSGPKQNRPAARRGMVACAGLLLVVAIWGLAACTKIEAVLIGIPIMTPNPAPAGTWVKVTVQLVDKAGCGQASINVNYNGATRPSHLASLGGTYTDSVFASLSDSNVQATGTCGGAVQTQTGTLTVTP